MSAPVTRPETPLVTDVRHGLSAARKALPPKYFYDRHGSRLFEEITRLEEYYPTRLERALLRTHAAEVVAESGAQALVELGAGNADKTRELLRALPAGARYVPVDISAAFLQETARQLRTEFPQLQVEPVAGDMLNLPPHVRPADGPVLFAFLGSTIGNFEAGEAVALLRGMRERMRAGDTLLLGADLVKDVAVLEAAYNDRRGVTAAFNMNLLAVLNRELGSDFDAAAFRHLACFDRANSRIEMHLVSVRDQVVRIPEVGEVAFTRGETIRTEISCKYTRATLEHLLARAGYQLDSWRTDPDNWYALLTARPVLSVATSDARTRPRG